jgi:excisionase family DNA binding protein
MRNEAQANLTGEDGRSRDLADMHQNQLELDVRQGRVLNEPLMTTGEAAELLALRPSWVADAARRGELPCIRMGKHVRFLRADLERWVEQHRT